MASSLMARLAINYTGSYQPTNSCNYKMMWQKLVNICDGSYFSLVDTLRLEDSGDMLHVGPVHCNTLWEIRMMMEELGSIAGNEVYRLVLLTEL